MTRCVEVTGEPPGLWKADIDSVFRRVPVAADQRWTCGVAFMYMAQVLVAQHFACPFGAVGAVHAWERVGAAIAHIARAFLKLPVLRYVDDFFTASRWF